MNQLEATIGSIVLRNPLILASGILGSSYSTLNKIYHEGFGAVVTKSVGLEPRDGYSNPSVFYIPETQSVINAVGLANLGYEKFGEELKNIDKDTKYVISVFGSSPEEFHQIITFFEEFELPKPIAFEINLSCPHADKVGLAIGTDPEVVSEIISEVKLCSSIPIWVKLTPNITDIIPIAEVALDSGADVIVAINTLKALYIDIQIKKPFLSNKRGGLSGRAIKPVGVRMIYDLFDYFGKNIPLIGVGGVWKWEDVIEYILAGACAVQIGSALVRASALDLTTEIITGIVGYLEENSSSLYSLRGLVHE
ncbi:dihydroorotate dehydrogenase [Candidatus Hodarchaeum mangrovi]